MITALFSILLPHPKCLLSESNVVPANYVANLLSRIYKELWYWFPFKAQRRRFSRTCLQQIHTENEKKQTKKTRD